MKKISTANFKRADRVADLIKVELSDIILRQIRNPRIGALTITDVEVTDDLKLAKIFFVELGKDNCNPETQKGLEQAKSFMKRELGKRLRLRYVPDIIFTPDESFAYGSRIEKLLAEIGGGDASQDH
ncbi:MAG TPA: 30S ribosome-binding factor RbfA [Syntrophales bacterium]|nr:30S ribosome-binding factor RbfA [Syntrophales bacterium]